MLLGVPLMVSAFIAGMLMFLAPCTLPIVPGYLAFIAGVPLETFKNPAARGSARRAVFRNAFAFVLGFSVVFILLGASAGLLGVFVGPWRYLVARLGGALVILFGLTMLGVIPMGFLSKDKHIRLPSFLVLGRMPSSFLIGALFALGWSPCIGPILGTVLLVASSSNTVWWGALLLAIFSAGLAVPFLLTALLIIEATTLLSKLTGVIRILSILGGLSLVLGGTLMLFGAMDWFVQVGYDLFHQWGYDALLNYL